jgi:hypothetical protein
LQDLTPVTEVDRAFGVWEDLCSHSITVSLDPAGLTAGPCGRTRRYEMRKKKTADQPSVALDEMNEDLPPTNEEAEQIGGGDLISTISKTSSDTTKSIISNIKA